MTAGTLDLSTLHLDVYDTSCGLWNPDYGDVIKPNNWDLLHSGNTVVTRRVKASGIWWTLWQPKGRYRAHPRRLGILAPMETITKARASAEADECKRAEVRIQRERRYLEKMTEAILEFLDFAPEYADLAQKIANNAAVQATEIGSHRVGRTRMISLEERAALAARACIRHVYTEYEERLEEELFGYDDDLYHDIKDDSHEEVDLFLSEHRLVD